MMNNNEKLTKVGINWYPGHMAKTKRLIKENLNFIDVVYEVVDSRIPYSSKIIDIEEYTKNKPKILIMTKSDLCDKKETKKWITYYESKGYIVISCDLINENITKKLIATTEKIMLEKEKQRENKGLLKKKYRVLVVGIPNVGKSTLINKLVGKKVAPTGNKPGVTKHLDWIRINDTLELLDTPGILWPKFENQTVALNLASLTAIKEEVLPIFEVISYILEMLEKHYKEKLKERYGVDHIEDDIVETLDIIGRKRGCLISKGEIDYEKVFNIILNDIKNGLIKGITFDRYIDE